MRTLNTYCEYKGVPLGQGWGSLLKYNDLFVTICQWCGTNFGNKFQSIMLSLICLT